MSGLVGGADESISHHFCDIMGVVSVFVLSLVFFIVIANMNGVGKYFIIKLIVLPYPLMCKILIVMFCVTC